MYINDLIAGADTIGNGFQLYQEAKLEMSDSGFNLHKWNSNSPSLLAIIKSEQNDQKTKIEAEGVNILKPEPDKHCLEFNGSMSLMNLDSALGSYRLMQEACHPANIQHVTAAIVTPMGFLSPFVSLLKVLFQMLCVNKSRWNDHLPPDLTQK